MTSTSAIFLDTTVQILRFIGSKDVKRRIDNRLARFGITITSLTVRQEFKRRLLTDIKYVRRCLEKNRLDAGETLRYINSKLGHSFNRRKLSICINILATSVFNGKEIRDAGETGYYLLCAWEKFGLRQFDGSVGQVVQYSECGCGKMDDLGPQKCLSSNDCGIAHFVADKSSQARVLELFLQSLPTAEKSAEILLAEKSLSNWLSGEQDPKVDNPCLTVGDLIIALESDGIPVFFTKNGKESQHFCRALQQSMVLLCENEDLVLDISDSLNWPKFK